MTDREQKPRGADRRGFFQFEWLRERRQGVERRATIRYERRKTSRGLILDRQAIKRAA